MAKNCEEEPVKSNTTLDEKISHLVLMADRSEMCNGITSESENRKKRAQ